MESSVFKRMNFISVDSFSKTTFIYKRKREFYKRKSFVFMSWKYIPAIKTGIVKNENIFQIKIDSNKK